MIFYYLDASAWVKRYYQEEGTSQVEALFQNGDHMACATLGVVEVMATLARKANARDIEPTILGQVFARVQEDWAQFVQIQLSGSVLGLALTLARDLALRGADLVHLASALALQRHLIGPEHRLIMVTSDHELLEAARASGLTVMDPIQEENR